MRTPEQAAALHGVPAAYLLQPPSPLQRPLCPQESCGSLRHCACGSGRPAGTTAHSPALPGRAQATQAPVQATLQQTPSAQNPEAQSAAVAHIAPRGRLSHAVPLQHRPRTQRLVVHSLSQAHVLPAAFFTAGAGEQGWTGTSGLVGDPPSRPPAMGMEIEAGPSAPILAPAPPPPGVPPRPSVPTAASAGVTLGSNSTSLVVQAVIATSKRMSCLVVCLIVRPSSEAVEVRSRSIECRARCPAPPGGGACRGPAGSSLSAPTPCCHGFSLGLDLLHRACPRAPPPSPCVAPIGGRRPGLERPPG
jgi:hypothetical protein